jgi:hypothetical protein
VKVASEVRVHELNAGRVRAVIPQLCSRPLHVYAPQPDLYLYVGMGWLTDRAAGGISLRHTHRQRRVPQRGFGDLG